MRRWCWIAALGLLAGPAAVPARAGELPRCRVVDFSPAFERDGTAFCAAVTVGTSTADVGTLQLYRTTDKGRSWQRRPATGLDRLPNGGNGDDVEQLVVSPRYPLDHQVVIQLQTSGLYRSTDGGDSFLPLDPAATAAARWVLTPFPGVPPPAVVGYQEGSSAVPALPGDLPASYAYAGPVPHRILSAGAVPAAAATAAGVRAEQFLVHPPVGPARHRFLVGTTVDGLGRFQTHLYRCDAELTCTEHLSTLPIAGGPVRFWLAPDYDRSRTILAAQLESQSALPISLVAAHTVVLWSRDGGRSFQPFLSAARILRDVYNQRAWTNCSEVGLPRIGFSFDRGRWYLRLSDWVVLPMFCAANPPSPPAPPGDAVYESRDRGRSWQRIAHGLSPFQTGRQGSMPWTDRAGPWSLRGDLAVRAGRLFVVARRNDFEGLFCSVDGGRSWRVPCAR